MHYSRHLAVFHLAGQFSFFFSPLPLLTFPDFAATQWNTIKIKNKKVKIVVGGSSCSKMNEEKKNFSFQSRVKVIESPAWLSYKKPDNNGDEKKAFGDLGRLKRKIYLFVFFFALGKLIKMKNQMAFAIWWEFVKRLICLKRRRRGVEERRRGGKENPREKQFASGFPMSQSNLSDRRRSKQG